MTNIKKNDVLKSKDGTCSLKILAVVEGLYCVSKTRDFDGVGNWYTFQELDRYYVIPKEEWEPKENEKYYYPELSTGEVSQDVWEHMHSDYFRKEYLGVFPNSPEGEKLAEQALAEIKEKIKK